MVKTVQQDVSKFPVMPAQCPTCPFRTDADGRHPDVRLVNQLQLRCLTEGNQICHHSRWKGKPATHLCRGARNYQIEIFYRLGLLDAPTDEAWERARETLASRRQGNKETGKNRGRGITS